jgi:hypothetical protein
MEPQSTTVASSPPFRAALTFVARSMKDTEPQSATVASFPPYTEETMSADHKRLTRALLDLPAIEIPAGGFDPVPTAGIVDNVLGDLDEGAISVKTAADQLGIELPGDSPQWEDDDIPIQQEAANLVHGARQAAYGHPSSDFQAMGRITGAIIQRWLDSEGLYVRDKGGEGDVMPFPDIPPRIVALIMTAVKLSRESAQPKRDNRVDLIGYVLCEDMIVEGGPDE